MQSRYLFILRCLPMIKGIELLAKMLLTFASESKCRLNKEIWKQMDSCREVGRMESGTQKDKRPMNMTFIFFKWANTGLFFVYFRSFQTNNTIFTTNQCEKCHGHPVYGARIRTHDLQNVSLLP